MARRSEIEKWNRAVFINCPFDPSYRKIRDAIVFAICLLGFEPHLALEEDTATEERLAKILKLIDLCPFGIHDLSYMKVDPRTQLARLNMSFELGLFLGYEYAGRNVQADRNIQKKPCLIMDKDAYRYRKSLSDLSGRDISAHNGSPNEAMVVVRNWLVTQSGRDDAPGGAFVVQQYQGLKKGLPLLCRNLKRTTSELSFKDYREMVQAWLKNAL